MFLAVKIKRSPVENTHKMLRIWIRPQIHHQFSDFGTNTKIQKYKNTNTNTNTNCSAIGSRFLTSPSNLGVEGMMEVING